MKKFLIPGTIVKLLVVTLLAVSVCVGNAGAAGLANSRKDGLRLYSINRILRLSDDEIDIGTAALTLSRQWGTPKLLNSYRAKIDGMAEDILEIMEDRRISADEGAIPIINEYLFEELGIRAMPTADDPDDLFLHMVIENKRGYCLSISVLYLSLAERIGLPIYGVVVPGHFFVRYDDGDRRFNIETTSSGAVAPDSHYAEKFGVPEGKDTIYLRNLSSKEVLGCFFNNLGNAYSNVGETDNALWALEKAIEIAPDLAEAHTNLGNIYLAKEWVRDAVKQYELALDILPKDARAYVNYAHAFVAMGKMYQAIDLYEHAMELDPSSAPALQGLASTYYKQGRMSKAIETLQAAVALKPNSANIHSQLGEFYRQEKQLDSAMYHYRKAVGLDNEHFKSVLGLGLTWLDKGNAGRGLGELRKAVAMRPGSADAHTGLAMAYNRLGRTDDEIRSYRRALDISDANPSTWASLGNAYMAVKEFESAAQCYRNAIDLSPQNAHFYYNLGVAYSNLKDHAAAAELYADALRINSNIAEAHFNLAVSFYHLSKFDEAVTHAISARNLGYKVPTDFVESLQARVQ